MLFDRRAYLDFASAAPVSGRAARAYARAVRAFGNPSSPHEEGRAALSILEAARTTIARLVEAKPDDVVFTSGATEANNLAIAGVVRPGSHVLYLPSAHPSIVETVRSLPGVIDEPLLIKEGRVDIEQLKKILRPQTSLVTMDAVCGETGTVWNTREVKHAIGNVLLHVDASQAPQTQKITRSHFASDLLTLDAQKVGGMRGIGCLIAPRTLSITPLLQGGGQERGLRPGTPSPALAASFAEAFVDASERREAFEKKAHELRVTLIEHITRNLPDVVINGGAVLAPNIVNISLLGRDTDYLVALLDEAGFAVSTRSACETDSPSGSRAVFALTGDQARAASTLRISFGWGTVPREVVRFAEALTTSVAFVDKSAPKSHY